MSDPFVLGVNYWPRRKAMSWWSDFDAGEVRDEFALIRELGLTLVRLFLLWDDFQPSPEAVDASALKHLTEVCDLAAAYDLALDITFFTGHMSGPNWAPHWLLEGPQPARVRQVVSRGQIVAGGYRNPFSDPISLNAERLLITTVVGALKDHPSVGMWNLGNEPDLFAWPPSAAAGRAWVREMVTLIRDIDQKHLVTCGLHAASLLEDNGLRVDQVFAETDVAVMHSYPMYSRWARDPLDPDWVPFTCALTSALAGGGRPTLMEEFGGCTALPGQPSYVWEWTGYGRPQQQFMASEEDLAAYFKAVLPKLVEVGVIGAVAWCFADYATELWDKPPCSESRHERFFGLVRPDGSLKPHAQVLKAFAESKPVVKPATQRVALTISPDEYYQDPEKHLARLYEEFLNRPLISGTRTG